MNTWFLNLNPLAATWLAALWRACWQGGLAVLLVWTVCRAFHRLPARAKSWLWRLAYVKLLVVFLWATPIALPLLPAGRPRPALEVQAPVSAAPFEIPSPAVSPTAPAAPAPRNSSAPTRAFPSQLHSAPPARTRLTAASWLLLIWSLGVGSYGICAWRDLRRARLLLRGCAPVSNPPLLECAAELARSLRLPAVPSLMMTDAVSSPLLLAGSRPVIVLPCALVSGSSLQHLQLMIAHEMAHLKRFDLWWVWLAVVGEGLFFFHPLLWLARREWRLTQEMACDEMAVRMTRVPASTYGDMLVGVAALKLSSRHEPLLVTLGLTETKEMLARRLNAMKLIKLNSTKRMALATAAILVVSAAGVLPWRLVAQPAPPAGASLPTYMPPIAPPTNVRLSANAGMAQIPDAKFKSAWNDRVLNMEFHDVNIHGDSLDKSWYRLCTDLLLQASLYWDVPAVGDSAPFEFKSKTTTGKKALEAFLAAYPDYTFTQDAATGIIWIHRKKVRYEDIFSQKIRIRHAAEQLPMWGSVVMPLQDVRSVPPGTDDWKLSDAWCYGVDLPAGVYAVRDILNFCDVPNPLMVFSTLPNAGRLVWGGKLNDVRPITPPRPAAVAFWHDEVSDGKEGPPTIEEIATALSDPNPRTRRAGCLYLEMTIDNYNTEQFFTNTGGSEREVWEALTFWEISPSAPGPYLYHLQHYITNTLPQLNGGLALLACMELAAAQDNPAILDAVRGLKLNSHEFAAIRPEFYRLVQSSSLVRDKLIEMKLDLPEASPERLQQLGDTNLFELVPGGDTGGATSPTPNSGQAPGAGMREPPATRGEGTSAQARAASNAPSVTNGAAPIASVGSNTPFASAILDHPRVKLPEQGPWTVSSADFMQMAPLIVDLVKRRDPMFVFLWNSLSSETRSALEGERAKMGNPGVPYKPGTAPQDLVANLNKLIQGKLIYDEPSFAMLKPYLSGDTVKLLNQPAGADVSRLNRLLLEDAFPLDIVRRPKILFDAAAQNYVFIDFAKKTVFLYGKAGEKKWTADLRPSIAYEFNDFPYVRNRGIPASRANVGLWDVSLDVSRWLGRTGMILVHLGGNAFYSVDLRTGKVIRLPRS